MKVQIITRKQRQCLGFLMAQGSKQWPCDCNIPDLNQAGLLWCMSSLLFPLSFPVTSPLFTIHKAKNTYRVCLSGFLKTGIWVDFLPVFCQLVALRKSTFGQQDRAWMRWWLGRIPKQAEKLSTSPRGPQGSRKPQIHFSWFVVI